MTGVLGRKLIDSLEFIRGCYKRLLYDLRCLEVHVIPLDFRVLILSIIVQPNLLGELRPYKELFETIKLMKQLIVFNQIIRS